MTLTSAPLAPVTLNVAWPTQFFRAIAPRNSGDARARRRRRVLEVGVPVAEAVGVARDDLGRGGIGLEDLAELAFPLFRLGSTDETNSSA